MRVCASVFDFKTWGLDYTVNLWVIIALQFAAAVPRRSNHYFYIFPNVPDTRRIKPSKSEPPLATQCISTLCHRCESITEIKLARRNDVRRRLVHFKQDMLRLCCVCSGERVPYVLFFF